MLDIVIHDLTPLIVLVSLLVGDRRVGASAQTRASAEERTAFAGGAAGLFHEVQRNTHPRRLRPGTARKLNLVLTSSALLFLRIEV